MSRWQGAWFAATRVLAVVLTVALVLGVIWATWYLANTVIRWMLERQT